MKKNHKLSEEELGGHPDVRGFETRSQSQPSKHYKKRKEALLAPNPGYAVARDLLLDERPRNDAGTTAAAVEAKRLTQLTSGKEDKEVPEEDLHR
jgi:hypothetical protein